MLSNSDWAGLFTKRMNESRSRFYVNYDVFFIFLDFNFFQREKRGVFEAKCPKVNPLSTKKILLTRTKKYYVSCTLSIIVRTPFSSIGSSFESEKFVHQQFTRIVLYVEKVYNTTSYFTILVKTRLVRLIPSHEPQSAREIRVLLDVEFGFR